MELCVPSPGLQKWSVMLETPVIWHLGGRVGRMRSLVTFDYMVSLRLVWAI